MDEFLLEKKKRAEKRRLDKLNHRRDIDKTEYTLLAGWVRDGENHIRKRKNSKREQKYKRVSNRKVRQYRGELNSPSDYRKIFDYWWTLY